MNPRRTSVIGWTPLWLAGAAQAWAPPQVPPAVGPVVPPAAPVVAAALPPLGPLTDDEFRLPLPDEDAANVDRLVPLLGSPDYKQRETATTALIEIGAPAFAKLRTAYEQADDLEARLRIEQVVRTAYLNRYVFDRNGFLGISLAPYEPKDVKGPRRTDIESGVRVTQIIANTGAAKAGLRADDVITAMNGTPVPGTGGESTARFSESIRQTPPGTKVRLTVFRDGNMVTLDATIGRCPEDNVGRVRFAGLYVQVSERFGTWWFKYFRNSPKPVLSLEGSDTADEP
jgi:hypothetical protein